jgi:U3 small nucleolar RNA-associated protein 7
LAAASLRGHITTINRRKSKFECDIQVGEAAYDIKFLNSHRFFAVAQKKALFIYNSRGEEIHCLKNHNGSLKLAFLHHQMLLGSIGLGGVLRYQDTMTGKIVAQHKTCYGTCDVMQLDQNRGILCLGHNNGKVTLWTPNLGQPVVNMLSHKGRVVTVANDPTGFRLLTTGEDFSVKIWDIRNFHIMQYFKPKNIVTCSDISQNGMIGLGCNNHIQILRESPKNKKQIPYLNYTSAQSSLRTLMFCPFDDFVLLGHSNGIMSKYVPGASEMKDHSVASHIFHDDCTQKEELGHFLRKLRPNTVLLSRPSR